MPSQDQTSNQKTSTSTVNIPEIREKVRIQEFAQAVLGMSDIAWQLFGLYNGLKNRSSDSILTGYVRQMSVSLRSALLDNEGRLITKVFKDGSFPACQQLQKETLCKVVVNASPYQEVDYTISRTGEQRTLKVPGYRHGFDVNSLLGIGKSGEERFAILGNREIWNIEEKVSLKEWVRQEIFEVDGLVYDLNTCIKTISDKEGAHIDKVVDSDGIYTGNNEITKNEFTNDDAYILSRMVKFGPFTYPHVVVIAVSRYLVSMTRASVSKHHNRVQSITNQFTLAQSSVSSIRERMDVIMKCPVIDRLDGFPLHVSPERLVMRSPIAMGLSSFADEQARANNQPQYGESYIGIPRR